MAVRRRQRVRKGARECNTNSAIGGCRLAASTWERYGDDAFGYANVYAGGGFPWGLLIIGGIVYFLWTKGVFDGRGRFSNGGRFGGFSAGYGPAQGLRVPGTDPALVQGREALPASAARARCSSGTGRRTRPGAHRLRLRRPPRRQRRHASGCRRAGRPRQGMANRLAN